MSCALVDDPYPELGMIDCRLITSRVVATPPPMTMFPGSPVEFEGPVPSMRPIPSAMRAWSAAVPVTEIAFKLASTVTWTSGNERRIKSATDVASVFLRR